MLKKLTIQNYALINELELEFGKGLNIITGETGAGKSILMGALGLLLGDRSDSGALLDRTRKCIIRGEFITNASIRTYLANADLDPDETLVIHREVNKEGKSRSFINETPVNLSQLRDLGDLLVDVHSQHETLLLNKSDFQLSVVDAFTENQKSIADFAAIFHSYRQLKQELNSLLEAESQATSEKDFLQFQLNELTDTRLLPGEQPALEEEQSTLTHGEEIKGNAIRITDLISGSDHNLLSGLAESVQLLSGISRFSAGFNDSLERLKALQIELKDISSEIESTAEKINVDPGRLEVVNDRLNLIFRLQQKHRVNSVEELIRLRETFDAKLASCTSLEEKVIKVQAELALRFRELKTKADQISQDRKKSVPGIENKIKRLLNELGMPEAVLKIEITDRGDEDIVISGRDKVRFLFSANKGIPYTDISKVASGGELSRLMLCLKASVARLMELPTMVFDEIDTGVSGETAFKIGKVMQELSLSHQLLSITHLPQIASRGVDHFFVYKEMTGKKTFTRVKKLTYDERIVEIARMLSGDKPTAISIENAKELLKFD